MRRLITQGYRGFRQFIGYLLVSLIKGYQWLLSPWIGNQCRFYPSCSHYGIEAIERHGPWRGSWLTVKRLLRCSPLCKGGHDSVPD